MSPPHTAHSSLLQLPIELLLDLNTFLPPSASVALALTSKSLYYTLSRRKLSTQYRPIKQNRETPTTSTKGPEDGCLLAEAQYTVTTGPRPPESSRPEAKPEAIPQIASETRELCAQGAIRTFLRQDTATRRRCVLCKNTYPAALFDRDVGFHGIPKPDEFCFWCALRLARVIVLPPGLSEEEMGALGHRCWYSSRERMCMHCGGVAIWDGQSCECGCEACWFRDVNVFTRFVCSWMEYPSYKFEVGPGGRLRVVESTPRVSSTISGTAYTSGELVDEVPVFPIHGA